MKNFDHESLDPTPRWPSFAWIALGIIAFIVFELTAQPAVVVVIGCLKFGWDELATSRWLKRVDPDRLRGRICGRFYAAWALWKVSIVATAMMFILAMVAGAIEVARGRPRPPGGVAPPAVFTTALLVAMLGFILSAGVSVVAVISAWRNGMRVWVGPEAKLSRRSNLWPPSLVVVRRIRANRVRTIIFSAIMTLLPCIGLFILLTGFRVTPSPEFMVALCFVTFLGVPVCVLKGLEFLLRRIAAKSAWECWPLNDAPAAYS